MPRSSTVSFNPDTATDVHQAPWAAEVELTHQIETLVRLGYPALTGMTAGAFGRQLAPLRELVSDVTRDDSGRVPFVLVVSPERVLPLDGLSRVELRSKPGFTELDAVDLATFTPIDGVEVPASFAYLVTDVDTGPSTLNRTPDAVLPEVIAAGRTPLTISEGIALVTHFPDLLNTRNCFSMLASRCGDKRVPALWVSRQGEKRGRPRLGWCWGGNPHTWLGSASAAHRVAPAA